MPKTDIDYSNTIFYKIYCKNPDIKDIYIGHTTNFVQRKYAHKRSCTYEKSANYTCKVYNVIREYGGWDNWKMEIIAFRECADHYEARKIEQQYFEEYNATLNSIEPFPKPKVIQPKPIHVKIEKKLLYCETCNVYFHTKNANDVHTKTNKHIKKVAKANKPAPVSIKIPENAKKFKCEKCEFECRKLCDYKRHLATARHNFLTNANNVSGILHQSTYTCICGNEYKHAPSLCKHKKICTYNSTPPLENTIIYIHDEPPQPTNDNSTELASDKLFVLVKDLMLQMTVKDKQHQALMSHIVTTDKQIAQLQNTMNEMISHLGNKKIYKKVLPEIKLDKSVI
jgi:hypothetical protein